MKYIITFLFIIMSFCSFAQNEYPKYIQVDDTLRVVFTVEQAQKINSDYELMEMYKHALVTGDSLNIIYIDVIDNLNQQVANYQLQVSEFQTLNINNNQIITALNSQIDSYQRELKIAKDQSDMKDIIIANQKKEIRKQKTQKIIGFIAGIGLIITTVVLTK